MAAQRQVAASIPRLPRACLHIVTRGESEESGLVAADATEMHCAGDLFDGICVVNMPQLYVKQQVVSHLTPISLPF